MSRVRGSVRPSALMIRAAASPPPGRLDPAARRRGQWKERHAAPRRPRLPPPDGKRDMGNAEVKPTHPDEVLAALCAQELDRPRQVARGRKLTLAACACCRRLGPLLADARTRAALETSERFADRRGTWAELEFAKGEASAARSEAPNPWASEARWAVWAAVWSVSHPELWGPQAIGAVRAARRLEAGYAGRDFREAERREEKAQLAVLRDVFADPSRFRTPEVDPGWTQWSGGTVVRMAAAV